MRDRDGAGRTEPSAAACDPPPPARARHGQAPSWEEADEARLLDEIRAALERRVDLLGLRPTARAIGLLPMSLRGFLDGGRRRPQEKTVLKLLAWHAAQSDPDLQALISAGVDLLTRGLRDPALRERLRRFLVEVTLKPSHERLDRLEAAL